jgi:hypothetical protein
VPRETRIIEPINLSTRMAELSLVSSFTRTRSLPPPPPSGPLGWAQVALRMGDSDLLRWCGADAYMFLRFLRMAFRVWLTPQQGVDYIEGRGEPSSKGGSVVVSVCGAALTPTCSSTSSAWPSGYGWERGLYLERGGGDPSLEGGSVLISAYGAAYIPPHGLAGMVGKGFMYLTLFEGKFSVFGAYRC